MKENVLDVLMYLFDHCAENEELCHSDQETLVGELEEAGFSEVDIDHAFNWLEGIHDLTLPQVEPSEQVAGKFRVFSQVEQEKISIECQRFLLSLEQIGLVDSLTREVILDRALALNMSGIKLDHFKWIVMMVLINRGNEQPMDWLEEVIFNEGESVYH